jgi:predicted O-linked N-acetylglucosamine transferase (SPINDLY family)
VERLVRLPNLSIHYEPLDVPPVAVSRAELGLRPDATVFWCGQSLYKYLPQYDAMFARIAREVPGCQFAFIRYRRGDDANALFRQRLDRAFAAVGLRAEDHCVVLPRLDQQRFIAATGQADIFLDSLGWSGCNSMLESLAHDLPVVTMGGGLMRGRHGVAILTMMGVTETIAASIDDYVAIASRLGRDAAWRSAVKARIAANKHRVYRDRACIVALEDFLDRVARGEPSSPVTANAGRC